MSPVYLITGAAGHLGGTLVRMLRRRGAQVRGLLLPGEDPPVTGEGISYVRGDVRDPDSLRPLFAGLEEGRLPALLSQIITVIKDTSFLRMVDIPEFMRNCSVVMGSIYDVRGMMLLYAFQALCYFVICFTLSLVVRHYQSRQGIARK